MTRLQANYGRNVPFVPETYTLSAKLQIGKEVAQLREAARRSAVNGDGNVWIVKPESRNRGSGITLHASVGAHRIKHSLPKQLGLCSQKQAHYGVCLAPHAVRSFKRPTCPND
jgi:Tubulin-tyrosine ligase family